MDGDTFVVVGLQRLERLRPKPRHPQAWLCTVVRESLAERPPSAWLRELVLRALVDTVEALAKPLLESSEAPDDTRVHQDHVAPARRRERRPGRAGLARRPTRGEWLASRVLDPGIGVAGGSAFHPPSCSVWQVNRRQQRTP